MVEKSIVVDFIRNPKFFDDWNQSGKFNVSGMNGSTQNYEFVLLEGDSNSISDYMNANGTMNTSAVSSVRINVSTSGRVALAYNDLGNGNRSITTQNSALEINLGDNDYYLKAILLIDRTTNYILAYSILQNKIPVTNKIVFPESCMIWTIRSEV